MAVIRQRKTLKGEKRFQAYIRIKGYKPVMKTFDMYSKAQAWAKKVEVQMKDGTYKDETTTESLNGFNTYADLIEYFKTEIVPKRYSHSEKYDTMLNWWTAHIGSLKIKELSSSHLASCKQILSTETIYKGKKETVRSNNTINKYLMCMSAVLTWTVKELELLEYNPMSKVKKMKKPNGRTRFLSEDEKEALKLSCQNKGEDVFIFFVLLISTGGRYSEVWTLQVENIDFTNSRIHFINTKNGTNRGIGISRVLLDMLKEYLQKNNIKSGYIFLNKNKTKLMYMRGKLLDAIKDAGLKDFHIHDLRHTFASKNAENGASLLDIAVLLGHSSLVMARRYTHLTQQRTDDLARKTAESFHII